MSEQDQPESFTTWGILELMGHVRMAGRITEEERFGAKMGRIDVPRFAVCSDCGGMGHGPDRADGPEPDGANKCPVCVGAGFTETFATAYFGAASIYRLTACTEEAARVVAKRDNPAPIHRLELPKPMPSPEPDPDEELFEFDEDEQAVPQFID